MENFVLEENRLREIERYKTTLRTEYSASLAYANPEATRRIELAINSYALDQYRLHQERIQTGELRISDGR